MPQGASNVAAGRPTPLFQGLRSGKSNEDVFLWWSHRGVHMVLHSQDPSDPEVPHQVG